jgi:hypothetical protein
VRAGLAWEIGALGMGILPRGREVREVVPKQGQFRLFRGED